MSALLCPKCQSTMRSYERSGVTVDRCTECGGLFLDRGEVERLVELEGGMAAEREPRRWPADRWEGDRWEGDRWRRHDDDDDEEDRREGRFGRRRGRRGGFLGDLLDFGD
jgi:uncharacterized protein